MVTTQRLIIYQIEDDDKFEILHSYDFNTSMAVVPTGLFFIVQNLFSRIFFFYLEDNDGSAYIQILLNSKSPLHRCDTLEQAIQLSREVQRVQNSFEEEKLIFVPSSEDDNEDFDE